MPEYARRKEPVRSPDFGMELAIGSHPLEALDRNPKDVPPPIVYDDEVGKTVLTFSKRGAINGIKAYDIIYQHNDGQPYSLSRFLGEGFFFHWTNNARFSTLADDGETPAVFVDYEALKASRRNLLALGHEMGHTRQRGIDMALWRILGTQATPDYVESLKQQYPSLTTHIDDLVRIRLLCDDQGSFRRQELLKGIVHKPLTGFDTRGVGSSLPSLADNLQNLRFYEAPLGPTHLYAFGFGRHFRHALPGVYQVLDAMGEQRAWEVSLQMEQEGIIHPGFTTQEERTRYMRSGLETYDRKYNTRAYTRWLRTLDQTA